MKAIIFDFDGVIHDTFKIGYKYFGNGLTEEQFKDIFNGNIFEHKIGVEKTSDDDAHEMQKEAFQTLKIDEQIKHSLEKLTKLYNLFIISSNREEVLNIYFKNNNFLHIFKKILGAESHRSKVEKFKYIFANYGLSKGECIFVTDTLGDILEGNRAGIKTIAVDFGFHERERLEKGNPFKIVSSFDEIMEVVGKL